MKGFTPFTKKDDDDDKKINAVIVNDSDNKDDNKNTDKRPGYCPGGGGSCPPVYPKGSPEWKEQQKKIYESTLKDKRRKIKK